jgi:hypothetical protein
MPGQLASMSVALDVCALAAVAHTADKAIKEDAKKEVFMMIPEVMVQTPEGVGVSEL